MYLKGLEIQGFKSFADRTKLQFDKGITAVVGPNGSGKSNISDAIRWVLGEQSTKALRGSRMEDVIFNGTVDRKAHGYAEVRLFVDNSEGRLPVEADEVVVTRKYYRSGDSEYKINDKTVRLRDIHELFMDTGLGRDGYSIIGQGRISDIISAKSGQRREIFEEAAGISRYRYRKEEAQRQLEMAEENLLRLKDIMTEIQSNLEPLRQQSEKASAFLKLSGRKKELDISLWLENLEQTRRQLKGYDDRLLILQGQYDEAEERYRRSEEELEALYSRMQQAAVKIDELQREIRTGDQQAADWESRRAVRENDILHNRQLAEDYENQLARFAGEGNALQAELEACQAQIVEREGQIQILIEQKSALLEQIQALSLQEEETGGQQSAIQQLLAEADSRYQDARIAQVTAGGQLEQIDSRLEQLSQSEQAKEQQRSAVQKELTDCRELLEAVADNLESLANMRKGVSLKQSARKEQLDALEQQRRQLNREREGFLQRASLLQEMENNMEGFAGSVRAVVRQGERGALRGILGPVSKLVQVEGRYALAIETAIGGALQNIVTQDETAAKEAIGYLKRTNGGRATFLPLTSVKGSVLSEQGLAGQPGFVGLGVELVRFEPQYAGVFRSLLGRIVVAEDLDSAVEMAKRYGYRFRIVTLDGQVVNAGGSLTGGSAARQTGLLSRQTEIRQLRDQAAQREGQLRQSEERYQSLNQQLAALDSQLLAIDSESKTASEDQIRYQGEEKRLRLSLEDLERSAGEAQQQRELLVKEREAAAQQLKSCQGGLELLAAQREQLTADRAALTEELAGLARQREELNQQSGQLEIRQAALAKEQEAARDLSQRLSQQQAGQTEQIQQLRERIAAAQEDNIRIQEEIREISERVQGQRQALEEHRQEIQRLSLSRQETEQETVRLRSAQKEITAQREELSREQVRLEEKQRGIQAEYDGVISQLWDEYELTRSQAEELRQPLEDPAAARKELTEIRGKIKALGSVNLAAIEQFEELNQRYTFMSGQINDVEQSRDGILKLIRDLTSQMKNLFTEKFQEIGGRFTKIFTKLFEGGTARLELTDPGNVLESGIEIIVQPPGKIINHLAALSGGEQAFVAIAIYFAIMEVSPPPFCVLDEIEAALDDVNVSKYASFLHTLNDNTQFIAITHRRGTMEQADVLYGVTMQEEGVSKLLQLKVSEVASKLGL